MSAILPGGTVGIFGGGQLGRMLAMAARPLGYNVVALDPDPSCAARFVLNRCWIAGFDDVAAAEELASNSNVVTVEIEKVSLASLDAAAKHAPVRPNSSVLGIIQDRGIQKRWLTNKGFPLGPYREAKSAAEVADAARALDGPCFLKTCREGYDGKGQSRLRSPEEAEAAFAQIGQLPCVVERALDLEAECSVLVARRPSGEVAVYPPALNHHVAGVLEWSVLPGPLSPIVATRAVEIARAIAEAIRVEGLLVVELFLTRSGELLVNELAPRPHNSFHSTEIACVVSQFEQAVRAVCDLPLGTTEVVRPTAICNLLGDLWVDGKPLAVDRALELPGVRLNLYGKRVAKPGRKMGHLAAVGNTPEDALARVQEAYARLQTSK
jgi:5-(carboxyamino)imidazole ribonucleotide synthase